MERSEAARGIRRGGGCARQRGDAKGDGEIVPSRRLPSPIDDHGRAFVVPAAAVRPYITIPATPTATMPDLAVDIRGIAKRYAEHVAVRELTLHVPRGSVYGLLGPNGAGKTTTIRMILNVIAPDEGTITVLGEPHRTAGMTDRMGYLPEERGLYKKMQVKRVLRFLAELKGVPKREAERRIEDWLERLQLKTAEKDWGLSKID